MLPVRDIDPYLHMMSKVKRLHWQIHGRNGLRISGPSSLESIQQTIIELEKGHPGLLRSPMDIHPRSFCIPFASSIIGSRAQVMAHPILVDVTYACFPAGFYLCNSVIYMPELQRFVPLFQAVIGGLSADHFSTFFTSMFAILKIRPDADGNPDMCGILMD